MTLLSYCANYCLIVTTNFSQCYGWLWFAAQPKLLFFYSGHPDVCTAIIIIIMIAPSRRTWKTTPTKSLATSTPENNSPFYSPPSQAGPLHQVKTLFEPSQSPWFGLRC